MTELRAIPVAGRDSMLMNLSGAHARSSPAIWSCSRTAPATPGGRGARRRKIRQTLEDARELVVGQPIGAYQRVLQRMQQQFADRDSAAGAADL